MHIALLYPASTVSSSGNAVTAARWAEILLGLGHHVTVQTVAPSEAVDVLIALNAAKTADAVIAYKAQFPGSLLVTAITGTDLHGTADAREQSLTALAEADRILCINPLSKSALPEALQSQARVILQSASRAQVVERRPVPGRVLLAGHLREEKNPFLIVEALRLLDQPEHFEVRHLGGALSEELRAQAEAWTAAVPQYTWQGEVSAQAVYDQMQEAEVLVLSSHVEGAPAVISEAISVGLPILATSIPGCSGLLGEEYLGLYPVGDAQALAKLLQRVRGDSKWLAALTQQTQALQARYLPEVERQAFADLLEELEQSRPAIA